MLMIVDAFANMEPKNLVMDHTNITFVAITICLMILGQTRGTKIHEFGDNIAISQQFLGTYISVPWNDPYSLLSLSYQSMSFST